MIEYALIMHWNSSVVALDSRIVSLDMHWYNSIVDMHDRVKNTFILPNRC